MVFNIKDFLPINLQISSKKALEFAKTKVSITQEEEKIIYRSRQSLLFKDKETWLKKGELFDVTMGACNGAKICELAGIFILHNSQNLNKINNFGLYRDDGLAVIKDMSGPQLEKVTKKLQVLFNPLMHNVPKWSDTL